MLGQWPLGDFALGEADDTVYTPEVFSPGCIVVACWTQPSVVPVCFEALTAVVVEIT